MHKIIVFAEHSEISLRQRLEKSGTTPVKPGRFIRLSPEEAAGAPLPKEIKRVGQGQVADPPERSLSSADRILAMMDMRGAR